MLPLTYYFSTVSAVLQPLKRPVKYLCIGINIVVCECPFFCILCM